MNCVLSGEIVKAGVRPVTAIDVAGKGTARATENDRRERETVRVMATGRRGKGTGAESATAIGPNERSNVIRTRFDLLA